MRKLCEEQNQLGMKHLIFSVDNVSLKTFGDSSSVKIVGGNQNIQDLVGEALKKYKSLEEGKQDDESKVFADSIVNLVAPPHSLDMEREGGENEDQKENEELKLRLDSVFLKLKSILSDRIEHAPKGYKKSLSTFEKHLESMPKLNDAALQKALCNFVHE